VMPASQLVRVIHICEHAEWHDLTHWPIRGLHITQIMQRLREQACTTCRQKTIKETTHDDQQ
jgi:hypothetical protein